MKTRSILIGLLMIVTAGCTGAGRVVADKGDDAVRLIGDDVYRLLSQHGDEVAQTSKQYADDLGRQTRYSDEALTYWRTYNQSTSTLLYREWNLTPLQYQVVTGLKEEAQLSSEQALLYLQGICFVADFVQKDGDEYPFESTTDFYISLVADQNNIPLDEMEDFVKSIHDYTAWLIENSGQVSLEKGAEVLFKGLCLAGEVVDQ